ncbi:MAG: hypothetical protein Q7T13_20335 [Polaromonas sp.]|nr:hypothetical protein [Polaromonas sp.]
MTFLQRFWFSFEDLPPYSSLRSGCGVTAYDYDDAVEILKEKVFSQALPNLAVIEGVDIHTLDKNHVLPNMGLVTQRGVWFPLGY